MEYGKMVKKIQTFSLVANKIIIVNLVNTVPAVNCERLQCTK